MNGSNTIICKQQKVLIVWPVILFGMTWYITGHVILENGALLWDVIWYVCRTCSVIAITTKTEPAKQRPRLNIIDSSCYVIEAAAVTTNSVNVSRSLGVSWPTLDGCIHFWPYLYLVLLVMGCVHRVIIIFSTLFSVCSQQLSLVVVVCYLL